MFLFNRIYRYGTNIKYTVRSVFYIQSAGIYLSDIWINVIFIIWLYDRDREENSKEITYFHKMINMVTS